MVNRDDKLAEEFLSEFKKLLRRLYRLEASAEQRQTAERSYIDGFMSAGLHLRLVTGPRLSELIESERARFATGPLRNNRQGRLSFSEPERDFSEYDQPTWERKGE